MTLITDVEALRALADGEQIVVHSAAIGTRRWTKTGADAFKWEDAVVGAQFFIGYVNQQQVEQVHPGPPEPGQWYTNARYDYFIIGVADDGSAVPGGGEPHFMTQAFLSGNRRAQPLAYRANQFDNMTALDGPPDRVLSRVDSIRWVVAQYQMMLAQLRSQQAAPKQVKSELVEPVLESVTVRLRQDDRVWEITRSDAPVITASDDNEDDEEPDRMF
jgi:hypothetical protein